MCFTQKRYYSSPPLVGTRLLPNTSVIIQVPYGDMENHTDSWRILPRIRVLPSERTIWGVSLYMEKKLFHHQLQSCGGGHRG